MIFQIANKVSGALRRFLSSYWLFVLVILAGWLVILFANFDWIYWSEQTIGSDGKLKEVKVDRSRTIQQFVLLFLGPIGLMLAGWRSWTAYRQADAAHKQIEVSERAQKVERYIKSVQLLESTKGSVRRAGLYSLGELAVVDSEQYYVIAIRTICGFARDTSAASVAAGDKISSEDLFASLQTIDRIRRTVPNCEELEADFLLNLSRLNLKKRNQRDLKLFNISVFGGSFEGVSFRGTDFRNSVFDATTFKNGSFLGCDLSNAEFVNCKFENWSLKDSNISRADFSRSSDLGAEFFSSAWAEEKKGPKLAKNIAFDNFRE